MVGTATEEQMSNAFNELKHLGERDIRVLMA
jgi:hypothetical protein